MVAIPAFHNGKRNSCPPTVSKPQPIELHSTSHYLDVFRLQFTTTAPHFQFASTVSAKLSTIVLDGTEKDTVKSSSTVTHLEQAHHQ